ncbi:MAG: leucyl aminopeptidase [Bacteroidales bacterium]|nr:leucyl aminopeptidase [Bacteroidales bacterium]
MNYKLEPIAPKTYVGNLIFLLGDEVAERALPLSKKEVDLLKERRAAKLDCIVRFDRLPYYIYVVSFNSEKPASECHEQLRRSAADLLSLLKADKIAMAGITGEGIIPEEMMAFVEGLTLADYTFDRYKTADEYHLGSATIDDRFFSADEFESNQRLWNRIMWCREWVNTPVQDLNAARFADELASIAADLGVSCTVFDKRQIESLRMGGLLAVNRGSVDEPRFVALEYKPAEPVNDKPLVLVGKGIMYDTGGLNIKPDDYMQEMKSDMAGAATMASVLFAAADNALPVHVVALLPMTDNRPGANAYAADDILTMYDGTTVEVVNTDAEGRLILADAIAYAAKNYNPGLIVDAATLTGAAVRAISTFGIAAMQQNAAGPYNLLSIVGEQVYERLVQFPFWSEYDELIKSEVADVKNCGTAQAGTITAGKFLARFAKDVPYIHLDIAGVAYFSKKQHYYAVGASGYGIRLLYAFMQTYDILNK